MSTMNKLVYNIVEISELLGTTVSAIQGHLARKNFDAVPPPLRLGKRLVWPTSGVDEWFSKKIKQAQAYAAVSQLSSSPSSIEQKRGRGRPPKKTIG